MARWVRGGLVLATALCLASTALPPATAKTTSSGRQKRACSRALQRGFSRRPKRLTGSPPAELTSILGVLRRPATIADDPPHGAVTGLIPSFYSGLWLSSARLLQTGPDGTRYFLIPGVYSPPALPAVCAKFLPPSLRNPSQRRPRGPAVAVEGFSAIQSGGIPYTASAIEAGNAFDFDLPTTPTMVRFYGVVPDGVASITVTAGGAPATTSQVANNFFLTQIPAPHADQPFTITQQWYASNGALIKTTSHTLVTKTFTGSFF